MTPVPQVVLDGTSAPEGWEQDSPTLYLHGSGVRIERKVYWNREGWVLIPVDLDRAVVRFTPDSEGLVQAFAAFAKGVLGRQGTRMAEGTEEVVGRDERADDSSEDDEKDEEDDS